MGCIRQKKDDFTTVSTGNSALKMHKTILTYFLGFDNVALKNVLSSAMECHFLFICSHVLLPTVKREETLLEKSGGFLTSLSVFLGVLISED